MSHRALTLKYRPQVFADMVGQDHVSQVLARALESGRIAHAYLFTGARGVGKTTSARILAKALNCQKRASGEHPGPDPCNDCTSCREITAGVSLDVAEIDGASNRGIADVQALREKVRFSPTGGRYRVVIIDEVHQLSNDAFAALLKTLEEPPPHLVFVFATTDPQKLPDTIRSRTQRYDFARVPFRKIADRLLEIQKREAADPDGVRFALSEGAALLIAHRSEGSMRDAVSALDQVISSGEAEVDELLVRRVLGLADREAFFALAQAISARDPKQALRALHDAFEKGMDPRDLAEGLSEHIRHVLILKVDPEGADLVAASREDLDRLRAQGEGWSEGDLLRLLRIASEAIVPMRDSSQPMLHVEAAVLQMATLEPGDTLADLLARLQAMEQRLGVAGGAGGTARGGEPGGKPGTPVAPQRVARTAPAPAPASASPRPASPAPPAPTARPPRATAPIATPIGAAASRTSIASTMAALTASRPAAAAPASSATALEDAPPEQGEETAAKWRQALQAIVARKRLLGAFLEESQFLGRAGNRLLLGMDDLHRAVVEEKDNRQIVAEELARVFGAPLGITCAPLDATRAAASPSPEQTHAMVARTLEWFGREAVPPAAGTDERTES